METPADSAQDNISAPASPPPQKVDYFNARQAVEAICAKTGSTTCEIRFGSQIVDGAVVEFRTKDENTYLGSGRVRLSNSLNLDKDTGEMALQLFLSDLNVLITKPQEDPNLKPE